MKGEKMKRIVTLIITVSLLMSVFAVSAAEEITPSGLLVIGDSISTGYGLPSYSSSDPYRCLSYANLIADRFSLKKGTTYVNKAVNGDTSSDLLAILPSLEKDIKNADAVIISIGGNDLLGMIPLIASAVAGKPVTSFVDAIGVLSALTKEQFDGIRSNSDVNIAINNALGNFSTNISNIAKKIKEASPRDRVIFLKQYNPMKNVVGLEALGDFADTLIESINGGIESAAENEGFDVADVPSVIDPDASELTNILKYDIHPNESGHKKIADLLIGMLVIIPLETEVETDPPASAEETTAEPNVTESESTDGKETGCASFASPSALFVLLAIPLFAFKKKRID